jgi:hypothetical protein
LPSKGIRELREPGPATAVCGLLFSDYVILLRALSALEALFGPVELTSIVFPFDVTDYYNQETGKEIKRLFLSFVKTVSQDSLAELKLACRSIEMKFAVGKKRQVNIDPGIVTAERLVLATSKNFTHRIYLGKGIHADLTLIYQGGSFRPLPWTFADYKRPDVVEFWNTVREKFMSKRYGEMYNV